MVKVRWRVEILESYSDGTVVVDKVKHFDTEKSAHEFVVNFNNENAHSLYSEMRPDWFMYASLPKKVED